MTADQFIKRALRIDTELRNPAAKAEAFHVLCADWREYQLELDGLDASEDDNGCGDACKP